MAQYDYIAVSLHGNYNTDNPDNSLAVAYSYTPEGISSDWVASLPDPEGIVRSFVSARECYVMWQNENGHYFGVVAMNSQNPSMGHVMVTVMLPPTVELPGSLIFRLLTSLKKLMLEEGLQSDEAVNQVLRSAELPLQPTVLPSWTVQPPKADAKPLCYRTYMSTREFDPLFSFPNQADYEKYLYTIVITVTCSLRQNVNIDRIVTPVKKVYSVITPPYVTPSARIVTEGDHLELTYAKDGFNPRVENVTVGAPSPYVKYEGAALMVKTSDQSGMGFVRRVKTNVRSTKGGLIHGYTITVNDRPVNTMEPYIELNEVDLRPGRKIHIHAASNNFHPLKVEVDPATIGPDTVINLEMEPIETDIVLRLDFGEGRVFEQPISLEKNTPEYSQLHSGNFHGFRAHRQAGLGEIYNIDVRATAKPAAPAFDNVSAKATQSTPAEAPAQKPAAPGYVAHKPMAPVFENVTEKGMAEKRTTPKADTPNHEAPRYDKPQREVEDLRNDNDTAVERKPLNWRMIASMVGLVCVIILALVLLPKLRSSSDESVVRSSVVDTTATAAPVQITTQNTQPEIAPAEPKQEEAPAPVTADNEADYKYLNGNTGVWKRSELKSIDDQKLFDAIAAGDIRAMANHPYFSTPGVCTNKRALQAVEYAWASQGSQQESANREVMKKCATADQVNVTELWDKLSRVQPKEKYNQPRPGAK